MRPSHRHLLLLLRTIISHKRHREAIGKTGALRVVVEGLKLDNVTKNKTPKKERGEVIKESKSFFNKLSKRNFHW